MGQINRRGFLAGTAALAAARGALAITSLAEESRPPAHAADEAH